MKGSHLDADEVGTTEMKLGGYRDKGSTAPFVAGWLGIGTLYSRPVSQKQLARMASMLLECNTAICG